MRRSAAGTPFNAEYDLESIAAELVGERLTGIRYFELPYFDRSDEGIWTDDDAHVVDFGVDLMLQTRCVGLTWNNDVVTYDLFAVPFSLVEFLRAARFEYVSERPPWSTIIGQRISDASVIRLLHQDSSGDVEFPFALELNFDNYHGVVLAAATHDNRPGPAFPGGDDIIVAWRPQDLRRLRPDLSEIAARWERSPTTGRTTRRK